MKILAVIVAGGRSARMGREKTFELIGGVTILDRIISRLKPQVAMLVINANGDTGRFRQIGLQTVGDIHPEVATPLAGLQTALSLAKAEAFEAVLTVPSDTPFLPADLVVRLAGAGRVAAIAASRGQAHYLTGLWSTTLLPDAGNALDEPVIPRLQDLTQRWRAATVGWPDQPFDPFFNVNTQRDLAEARRIAADFGL